MKKRITLCILIVLSIAAIGAGIFFGGKAYQKNHVSFTVADTLADGEGRRAHVILLAGQSNASGCSRDDYLKKNVSADRYLQYERGFENIYINYYISGGMNASAGFVPVSTCQGEAGGHFGPEIGMAEKLTELYPDEEFFIIKYAWGGTNLFEQWRAPSSKGKTGRMYREFEAYVKAGIRYLASKNYDVVIEGMCWMQGESDSFSTEDASNYAENLGDLVSDVRHTFRHYAPLDGIAFIDAYIADNPVFWVYCDIVNEEKRQHAESSPLNDIVDTIAHGLITTEEPKEAPDIPHYDSMSEIKLGHLFIQHLSVYIDGE